MVIGKGCDHHDCPEHGMCDGEGKYCFVPEVDEAPASQQAAPSNSSDGLNPPVVCLCGSTRFKDAFDSALRAETLAGKVVLSVGLFGHLEGLDMDGETKKMLDALHLRKIDMSDEVLILNVGGYIGNSTRNEIEYASRKGKRVRFLEGEAV